MISISHPAFFTPVPRRAPRRVPRRQAPRHQRGFTLIETMAVLLIVSLLTGAVVSAVSDGIDRANLHNANEQLGNTMIQQILSRYGSGSHTLSGTTKTQLNVLATTQWGDSWTVSATAARSITIVYPMDGASDQLGIDLAASLTAMTATSIILTATYNTTTDDLTVVYTI